MNRKEFLGLLLGTAIAVGIPSSLTKAEAPKPKVLPPPLPKKQVLRARWSTELEQDLKAYHGINAEDELMRIMTEEISREIDNHIIKSIING